jgi:hypothetical protein
VREPAELVAALACGAALLACAGGRPESGRTAARYPVDPRFEELRQTSFTPPPEARAGSDDTVPLRAADASESARHTALTMVQALLAADAAGLQQLFAERVVYGMEGVGRPRAEIVDRCIEETRALAYEPGLRPEHVVDVNAIEVQRADRFHTQVPLPPGVRRSDLLVTLPLRNAGTDHRPRIPCVTAVYVRPGEGSAIVALSR